MGIDDPFAAYCLDQAVYRFGQGVEDAVHEAGQSTGKNDTTKKQQQRAQRKLESLLGITPKFADPTTLIAKKAKANG